MGLPVCHIVGLPGATIQARARRAAIRTPVRLSASRTVDLRQPTGASMARRTTWPSPRHPRRVDQVSRAGIRGAARRALARWIAATCRRGAHDRDPRSCRAPAIGVPTANAEASLVADVDVFALDNLDDAARLVAGPRGRRARAATRRAPRVVSRPGRSGSSGGTPATGAASAARALRPARARGGVPAVDLAEVRVRWPGALSGAGWRARPVDGQAARCRRDAPGRTIPGLLPPLDDDKPRGAVIASGRAARGGPGSTSPVRAPHHTASYAALSAAAPGAG